MDDPIVRVRERVSDFADRPESVAARMIWKYERRVVVFGLGLYVADDRSDGTRCEQLGERSELTIPANARDRFESRGKPFRRQGPGAKFSGESDLRRQSLCRDRLVAV